MSCGPAEPTGPARSGGPDDKLREPENLMEASMLFPDVAAARPGYWPPDLIGQLSIHCTPNWSVSLP